MWPFRSSVSSQAKDLVARMLCVDVDKRISIAEIQVRCTLRACTLLLVCMHLQSQQQQGLTITLSANVD